jgi:NADP-dependent 3-hydroxy acid dehydrogenase YdfG
MDIGDKVILITGASSGIGEGIAREPGPTGAKLVLGARRLDKLEALARDLNDNGGMVEAMKLDVTDNHSVKAFAAAAFARFGRIDLLINNAGVMLLSPLGALKTDEWDRMVDVNVKGVLWGIGAVLPVMTEQGSGEIITIGSEGAYFTAPTAAIYCAPKYAVRAISDGLRQETDKIRVTLVNPGVVDSELATHITDESASEAMKTWRRNLPMLFILDGAAWDDPCFRN